MAIAVNFYTFSKKVNSTARPSGSGTSFNCNLKDSCSIENPVIELNVKPASWFNYAYISDFNRYYYVSGWNYFRGIWSADLSVDVLASFKTTIGNSSKYILRSSHTYDKEIKDTLYPLTSVSHKLVSQGDLFDWSVGFTGGTYIAYINSGHTDSSFGSLGYMYFTPTQFSQLLEALYPASSNSWNTTFFTETYNTIAGVFVNPIDYITKVVWVPVSLPAGNLGTWFGNYVAGYGESQPVLHGNLTDYRRTQTLNITIPKRPDTIRGAWANTEPYGKYYLYYAPFGIIPLPSQMLMNAVSIDVIATLDLTTGDLKLRVYTIGDYGSNKDCIWSGTSNVGVEVPVDKAKTTAEKVKDVLVDVGGMATNVVAGNYAGAVSNLVDSIGTMNEAPPKSTGNTHGILALERTIYLYYEYNDFVEEDNANKGRPLCQMQQISDIPGFMICSDGELAISGTESEQNQIRSYLEGGFYYE